MKTKITSVVDVMFQNMEADNKANIINKSTGHLGSSGS